jgi:uncharacterized protein (TIGR02186 family)
MRLGLARLLLSIILAAVPAYTVKGAETSAVESIEADVSTRNVSIEADFVGAEIVVFGTVENSQQPSAEAGTYDVVIIVEGAPEPLVVRRRSNVGGLWINANSIRFASLPNYYAISSTRPIYDIAETDLLKMHEIGFEHIRMTPSIQSRTTPSDPEEIAEFRNAVVRLRQRDGLYSRSDYGVAFVGRSLFRATMPVPPNVPVGKLQTRVFLFREGVLLGQFKSQVTLERAGLERFLYDNARRRPFAYGIATVLFAVIAGFASFLAFRREA